jgi:hypothetical protein
MINELPVEFFALVFGCSKSADARPSDVCDFNYSSLRFMVNSCLIYNGEHSLSKGEGCQHSLIFELHGAPGVILPLGGWT